MKSVKQSSKLRVPRIDITALPAPFKRRSKAYRAGFGAAQCYVSQNLVAKIELLSLDGILAHINGIKFPVCKFKMVTGELV